MRVLCAHSSQMRKEKLATAKPIAPAIIMRVRRIDILIIEYLCSESKISNVYSVLRSGWGTESSLQPRAWAVPQWGWLDRSPIAASPMAALPTPIQMYGGLFNKSYQGK